jgi:hypothetical protein
MKALYMSRRLAPHMFMGESWRLPVRRGLCRLSIVKHHIRSLQSLDFY